MASSSVDALALARDLIRCPSVTPDDAGAFDVLEAALRPLGFACERLTYSAPGTPDVTNLFAHAGNGKPHLAFCGHVDVVPPGPAERWTHPPFGAEIADGRLYGRGAADMKGDVAAFVAAAARFLAAHPDFDGRLSFLVTADEEGPAINGIVRLMADLAARGEVFDACLVGEPTGVQFVGDTIKTGRRGSMNGTLVIEGRQGHSAYPKLADNPTRALPAFLMALMAPLDEGTPAFEASRLEVTGVESGAGAFNVIPGTARVRFNARFGNNWTIPSLQAEIEARAATAAETTTLRERGAPPVGWRIDWEPNAADAFLTRPGPLVAAMTGAVEDVTGRTPVRSTAGGTSDARFVKDYCPVAELGMPGGGSHQIDESVAVADLEAITDIYALFIQRFFGRT